MGSFLACISFSIVSISFKWHSQCTKNIMLFFKLIIYHVTFINFFVFYLHFQILRIYKRTYGLQTSSSWRRESVYHVVYFFGTFIFAIVVFIIFGVLVSRDYDTKLLVNRWGGVTSWTKQHLSLQLLFFCMAFWVAGKIGVSTSPLLGVRFILKQIYDEHRTLQYISILFLPWNFI